METIYSKVCDKCNGKPHVFGYRKGFFSDKIPYLISICDKCTLGIMQPKEGLVLINSSETKVSY